MVDVQSVWKDKTGSCKRCGFLHRGNATPQRPSAIVVTSGSSRPPEDKQDVKWARVITLLATGSAISVGGLLLLHVYVINAMHVGGPEAVQGAFPDIPIIRDTSLISAEGMRAIRIRPSEEKALEVAAKKAELTVEKTQLEKDQRTEGIAAHQTVDKAQLCAFRNLNKALRAIAVNKLLFLQVIPDNEHVPLARNNYETIKNKTGASNILFVCTSREQCESTTKHGIQCYLNSANSTQKGPALAAFSSVHTALLLGYKIIYMNFEVSITSDLKWDPKSKTVDMILPYGLNTYSNSFYVTGATINAISFHSVAMQRARASPNLSHQAIFKVVLNTKVRNKQLHVLNVSTCQSIPPNQKCPITRHFYMATAFDRILWLKEKQMWYVDDKGYYSSLDTYYVSYTNTFDMGNRSEVYQLHALKNALAIGQVLNRTVILPKFICWTCKKGSCSSRSCLLSSLIDMKYFDDVFKDRYREHSFRGNPRVPWEVRKNVSEVMVFRSPLHKLMESLGGSRVNPRQGRLKRISSASVEEGPTSEEILSLLGHYSNKILLMENMYGSFSGFTDAVESLEFERKLKAAIVLESDKRR